MQDSNESRCSRGMKRARCADRPSRHCVHYANACVRNHRKTHYLSFPRDALVSGASEGRHGSRIAMQRVSWQPADNARGFFSAEPRLSRARKKIAWDRKRGILIFVHDPIERETCVIVHSSSLYTLIAVIRAIREGIWTRNL